MRGFRSAIFAGLAVIAIGSAAVSCAPREIPYAQLDARYGLAASQHFSPEPGLDIHFTDEGPRDAPTVIMVHGFAASLHAWRPWVERIGARYRSIALDLPGHGLTRAPPGYQSSLDKNAELVGKLADHLGVKTFVLAGNSMGGAVSWTYAMAHPERLRGLVLVDAAGWPGDRPKGGDGPPAVFALMANPVGRGVLKSVDPGMFAKGGLKSAYLDPSLVTDDLVARYRDLALAPGHRDILLTQRQSSRRITPADFQAIKIPTLVMSGETDKLIPVAQARAMAAAIPGAKLVTYPNVGHVPMEQIPDASAKDLEAFLVSLPAAAGAAAAPN